MPLSTVLEGLRVLDLSRLLPGPFLTMILTDMGADVVKVEDPRGGDYLRDFPPGREGLGGRFLAVNRNKRSVAIDLKTQGGVDRFLAMVGRADVVVESFRPGVMDRLGVGYARLRERKADIILCSISGYGQTGPYRDRAGHDLNYVGLAGIPSMTGSDPAEAPVVPGVQVADLAGGSLWGAVAVLGALIKRNATGEGSHLDVSMTDGALSLLAAELGHLDAGGSSGERGRGLLNGGVARYGVYRTKDGKYLSVGALEDRFLDGLERALEVDLGEDARSPDPEAQAGVRRTLATLFCTRTLDEWLTRLADHDCCCEPVLELSELSAHPLHRERGMFFHIDDPQVGRILQVRTPLGHPTRRRRAPRLGEHDEEVFEEYGVS